MALNLLNMLNDQIGGDVMSQASKFLGESEAGTKSAMGAALPAILGSLMSKGATTGGAEGLLGMLSKGGHDGSIFSKMGSIFGGGSGTSGLMNAGSGILQILMGNKVAGVIDLISSVAGIKRGGASNLLSLAAPMVLGMLGKVVKKNGLNAGGLMDLLMGQKKHVAAAAPAGMADLLGFANMGSTSSSSSSTTKTTKTNYSAPTPEPKKGGFLKWIIPALLLLGLLGFFGMRTGCGAIDNAANTVKNTTESVAGGAVDAVKKTGEVAGDVAGKAVDVTKGAADAAVDVTKNAAGAVADGAGAVLDAATATARKALDGIKFAAGSVGEGFVKVLGTGKAAVGKTLAFKNLNFAIGKADIDAKSLSEVDNLASVLKAYPNVSVEVGGHTDNTGNAAKNVTLSQARADAVKARLISKGIAANRISTKGYGASAPKESNDTPAGRKANRRTVVKITKS